jgi:RNA polymerase sigma-70 factor, ECF subfamily
VDSREFVADLCGRLAPDARAVVATAESGLIEAVADAKSRWPALPLDAELSETIARRLGEARGLAAALPRFRIGDLALATWAGRGDPVAIAAFDTAHADVLAALERRFHRLPADELRQQLRIKLFVEPARIRDYTGFGFLENWFKVTAVRVHLDAARAETRRRISDELDQDELLDLPSPATSPELANLNAELAAVVKRAFSTAVAQLSPRERNFLRHAHVEGRTQTQIANTYHVNRVAVSRVLMAARTRLLERMRDALRDAGAAGEGLESLVGHLDSRLDLSLSRVLRPTWQ